MANLLLSGPAASGKSQRARDLLLASQVPTVVVDFQSLYAALLQLSREESGRYPPRSDADVHALALTEYIRRAAITGAISQGIEVIATNSDGNPTRRAQLLGLLGAGATEQVVDPGIDTVRERLAVDGVVSPQCEQAIQRWFGNMRETRDVEVRREAEELHAVLIQEGRASSGGRRELFTPGAIQWRDGVDILAVHRGKVETRAIPERQADGRITVVAALTDGLREAWNDGRRFMSVEFHALEERTVKSGIREVSKALVVAGAMVKKPEYDAAVAEVRDDVDVDKELYRWL